jgi:hypothetical protein
VERRVDHRLLFAADGTGRMLSARFSIQGVGNPEQYDFMEVDEWLELDGLRLPMIDIKSVEAWGRPYQDFGVTSIPYVIHVNEEGIIESVGREPH